METLNIKGMVKNHNLAESIQDVSWGEFKRILKYKAEWYGREIIEIGRWFPSSKLCNKCGYKNKSLKLSDREWICPECGETHDRDINASINIRNEGLRVLKERCEIASIGLSSPEFTLVDCPLVDDKGVSLPLKSYDRKKQESKCILDKIS